MRLRLPIFLLGVLAACRAQPALDGDNLFDCDTCPEGMRCHEGVCVNNSIPGLRPFATREVEVGGEVAIPAEAFDADGDPLTVVWQQVDDGSPRLLDGAVEGLQLTLQADESGSFVFEVTVADGFAVSAPATLTLLVHNNRPTLTPDDDRYVVPGTEVTIDAQPSDLDAMHVVEVRWTQLSGEPLTFAPFGDTLTVTPTRVGLNVFEAIANDGYEDSDPVLYRVMAEPVSGTVYVSGSFVPSLENSDAVCGALAFPCASMAEGLALARESGVGAVVVASQPGGGVYAECLALAAGEQVYGGFDPVTWEPLDALRARTVFTCEESIGHTVVGDAHLEGVTLHGTGADAAWASTLALTGSGAQVIDVDVWAPRCGGDCTAIGVLAIGSTALLSGVEVGAVNQGFRTQAIFIGVYALGGAPRVEGRLAGVAVPDRALAPDARGGVRLNGPVTSQAWGVLGARSDLVVSGLAIEGGLGANLEGLRTFGGDCIAEGNAIDLTAYGTERFKGVAATLCAVPDAFPCLCDLDAGLCATPDLRDSSPHLVARNNGIVLRGESGGGGQAPCEGFGLQVESTRVGHVVEDNHIALTGETNLAAGMLVVSGGTPANEAEAVQVLGNDVTVEGGRSEVLCLLNTSEETLSSGAVGAAVGGQGLVFNDNVIVVGAHETLALGLVTIGGSALQIRENTVRVGLTSNGWRTPGAGGVLLNDVNDTGSFSVFAQNAVEMGGEAQVTFGISMGASAWILAGNEIYGGRGIFSGGITIASSAPSALPVVINNTIYAGGDPATTLSTRAVAIDAIDASATVPGGEADVGTFYHNVIDAGRASGRRYLIHNGGEGFLESVDDASVHQWIGPTPALEATEVSSLAGGTQFESSFYFVLLPNAGEIVGLSPEGVALKEEPSVLTPGRVTYTWGGAVSGTPWVVAISDLGLSRARVERSAADRFTPHIGAFETLPAVSYETGAPLPRVPVAAVAVDFDLVLTDLAFIERASAQAPGGLFVSYGAPGGGLDSPVRVDLGVPLEDPLLIQASNEWLFMVERTVDDLGVADGLYLWAMQYGSVAARWDLGARVGGPAAAVTELSLAQLGATTQQVCTDFTVARSPLDISMVVDGAVYTFLTPCMEGALPTPMAFYFPDEVCPAASVQRSAIGEIVSNTLSEDLFVVCDDRSLEAYFILVAGEPRWFPAAVGTAEGEVRGVTVSAVAPAVDGEVLLTEWLDPPGPNGAAVARIYVVDSLATSISIDPLRNRGFLADVARLAASGPMSSFGGSPMGPYVDSAGCALALAEPPGTPESTDLHLVPTSAAQCLEQGAPFAAIAELSGADLEALLDTYGLSTDRDGDVRDRDSPDIGADEVP